MDKNINQPAIEFFRWLHTTSKINLSRKWWKKHVQEYYEEWLSITKSERPAEAPASSGHTATQCRICFELYEKYFGRLPKENDEALDFAHFVSDEIKAEAAKEYLGGLEVADGVNESLSKELQEAKGDRNYFKSYSDDLREQLQETNKALGISENDLIIVTGERDHIWKELQEARAALKAAKTECWKWHRIHFPETSLDMNSAYANSPAMKKIDAALSTNLKDR